MRCDSPYRTIKQARQELREWAKHYTNTRGFGGSSAMYKFMMDQSRQYKKANKKRSKNKAHENALKGVDWQLGASAKEKPQSAGKEITVRLPRHIEELDSFIESLPDEYKKAIRDKYLLELTVTGITIDMAENKVMTRN